MKKCKFVSYKKKDCDDYNTNGIIAEDYYNQCECKCLDFIDDSEYNNDIR